jgi:hypothetical protein
VRRAHVGISKLTRAETPSMFVLMLGGWCSLVVRRSQWWRTRRLIGGARKAVSGHAFHSSAG